MDYRLFTIALPEFTTAFYKIIPLFAAKQKKAALSCERTAVGG